MENLNAQTPLYNHKTYQRYKVCQTLKSFAEVICKGDIKSIMEFYSDDIIAFDMMPPLEFTDKDKYQKSWQEYFTNYFKFPVHFDYEKQKFSIDGDVAFTHALVHMSGELKDGEEKVDMWMRNTTCLKKVNGKWLITHEHNSIPMDNELKGLVNLHPENLLH